MKRHKPDEIYVTRLKHNRYLGHDKHWKVTARFSVQGLSHGKNALVPCVRVRCYIGGHAIVEHFTEKRFKQLFKPASTKTRKV